MWLELNNPLTGILGNAELLLAEMHRKNDGQLVSRKKLGLWGLGGRGAALFIG